jgi:dolichyl-phosphate-mannose-protein mannosyltransferase
MTRNERWVLVALIVFAAALRIVFNDVARYSAADERHYVETTRALVEHGFFAGYRGIVVEHLQHAERWIYPPPLRWGYFALTTLLSHLRGSCDPRGLAWLSLVAGVACVPLTFLVGRRLVGGRGALFGAALVCVSPLELAMSRRALSDEVFCAAALLALWTLLSRRRLLALAALTFLFAVKETAFLLYPAFVLLLWLERRADGERLRPIDLAVLALPPILYFLVGSALSGSIADFAAVARTPVATVAAEYPTKYQAGPPHRLLIDLFALSPLVCIGACFALAFLIDMIDAGARRLAVVTLAVLVVFCVAPSKNVRYVIFVDPLLRLLVGWMLAARLRTRIALALVVLDAVVELTLFLQIFLDGGVYDPVSDNLFRALKIIP